MFPPASHLHAWFSVRLVSENMKNHIMKAVSRWKKRLLELHLVQRRFNYMSNCDNLVHSCTLTWTRMRLTKENYFNKKVERGGNKDRRKERGEGGGDEERKKRWNKKIDIQREGEAGTVQQRCDKSWRAAVLHNYIQFFLSNWWMQLLQMCLS